MTRRSMICEPWSIVVIPYPFNIEEENRRRPAVVLTKRFFNESGRSVLAMITTRGHKEWPGDTEIEENATAGLPQNCIVRMKVFTLDNRLILKQVGRLAEKDRKKTSGNIRLYLF